MYLFKHIKIEKDSVLVGRPKEADLAHLFLQGYQTVLDIMPAALKDKKLARRVRAEGMSYHHIPVEECDLESCHIEDEWVVQFFRFVTRSQGPIIINTDDEVLGISLIMLINFFMEKRPWRQIIGAIEDLGISLKGRKDIKRFIGDFYKQYHSRMVSGPVPGKALRR
jgi:protein tyrosine phosphatase (PTP) superfamily phosphohydrolase (DUF442 family)